MAAYCTIDELLERKDERDIRDLVSDTGVPDGLTPLVNQRITEALEDAAGDIETSLLVGGRYSVEDLENLEGNAKNYLTRMNAEIAMCYLIMRRPEQNHDLLDYYMKLKDSYLDPIRKGVAIFPLPETIDASKAHVDGPTTADFDRLNLMRDRVNNYYPGRRLPNNR
ncbi:DUF1320 domain-containing protein [bacterium]|nr:DUF1320 domain-containing protein [bacterium]